MASQPEYFLIGHFAKDLLNSDNFTIGGTVYYSGITAKKLGFKVKILTSFGEDIEEKILKEKSLRSIEIFNIVSSKSTTFKNIYFKNKDNRRQYLFSTAKKISFLPWSKKISPKILHLAPLIQEINPKIIKNFSSPFIGATLQGWLRKSSKNFLVVFSLWKGYRKWLTRFNVSISSLPDFKNDFSLVKEFSKYAQLLVVTQGKKGCLIFQNSKIREIPVKKVVKDGNFTGAGDVFAAAFFVHYHKNKNPYLAGIFANEMARKYIENSLK